MLTGQQCHNIANAIPFSSQIAFLIPAIALLGACTSLFFQPERKHYIEPAQINIEARNIYFKTRDGLTLDGWFLPAKEQAQATILFLHGNARNISTHIASVCRFYLTTEVMGIPKGNPALKAYL